MASLSGWLTLLVIAAAACVPLITRLRLGKRASAQSRPVATHAALGLAAAGAAFLHTLFAVTALGTPEAIGGGMTALLPAALAVLVLMAHVGVGLQLRAPKLRDRAEKRRTHQITAVTIAVLVAIHVVALLREG